MSNAVQIDRAGRISGRGGEEALAVGAFREADGVVDGVAGAVDLSHTTSQNEKSSQLWRPGRPKGLA